MDVVAELEAEVDPDRLLAVVSDLSTYPQWLDIVESAVPDDAHAEDPGPAWRVDLRGQLGPFRRSKRLRMVRAARPDARRVEFSRRELDGRQHSEWTLSAELRVPDATGTTTELTMHLHYGGSLWVPLLDRLLAEEVERSRSRLVDLVGRSR